MKRPDKDSVKSVAFIVLLWLAMFGLAQSAEPTLADPLPPAPPVVQPLPPVVIAQPLPPVVVQPIAKVTGKTVAKTGDLIVLDSKDSTPADAHRKWTVWPDLTGSPSEVRENVQRLVEQIKALEPAAEVNLPTVDDGDGNSISIEGDGRLILASYPGVYRVMLAVSNPDGLAVAKWTVTVTATTPKPCPPDSPDPDPPSDPDPPTTPDPPVTPPDPPFTNRFDLEQASRLWLVQIPNETLVERAAMQKIFRTIGQGAVDGLYGTMDEVQVGLGKTINDADAAKLLTKRAWDSWGKSASGAIVGLKAAGKVTTPQDYGQALLEIAAGLEPR